ncbi:4F2 cell-surface antigen heavy chain [Amphiprion ocellaris]|uniref:Solute carrier family 3 member 2 N-terminal domain-containing protein n=1 Tax=Amphiprion ocellaris TaxID=80972 RepID=A0A3Q1B2J3_AMPOC|nr:4F2 cell-surface antigen heavy chain [Amphiprion ocellaris]XP_035813471.1 4F2 cell-surface antigen heavy chain [Amphiprion ocellaris]
MPLNAGDTSYGSVPGPGLQSAAGGSEAVPLLIPEPESGRQWEPMNRRELEVTAGGPGWRKVRCYLVLLFWLSWVSMLAVSIAIITISPRPVEAPLRWWQKSVFYQLEPELLLEARGSEGISAVCEQLPFLRSLGVGALILEGLFKKEASPLNLTAVGRNSGTEAQIQHLLLESNKAGVKVVLDFCELDLSGHQDAARNSHEPSNFSASVKHALRHWLEKGVAGFAICDTDAAYSEKTLLEWRGIFKEFSAEEEERIVVVKQTADILRPLNSSGQINATMVNVVMRSILPYSHHILSTQEVADAIEKHLQTQEGDLWPSWTVGGKTSHDLKKLLMVLMMTLPGSPAVQYDEQIDQTQHVYLEVDGETDEPSDTQAHPSLKDKRSAAALFTSLSRSRSREEALLYGSFTFLPFNTSSSSSSSNSTFSSPSSPPVLAFLRSWGCVHFLVLLNIGPEVHPLDPNWASNLPEAGVFVTSTGMDRLGSTSLDTLQLQPHEAIVIKLFKEGGYS